jgi:SSS family solute:Na+ symporter
MMMIALLCATLSTGGSIVIANANILTNDIFKKCLKPDMSEKTRYTLIRVSVFISAAFFAVPAFLNAVLFPVFIWCFTFGIPIFVIYMMSMKVRVNQRAAWLTIIIVYAVSFLWTFTPIAAALGVADGPLGLNLYPVFILSIILGVILPLVVPGGSKAWLKTDAAERERIAMGE